MHSNVLATYGFCRRSIVEQLPSRLPNTLHISIRVTSLVLIPVWLNVFGGHALVGLTMRVAAGIRSVRGDCVAEMSPRVVLACAR
jgi:hypothetical protein